MTLSPFLDLPLVRSPFLSLSFSLSRIFEFRRFHVTDARRFPEERKAAARRERGQYLYWTRERVSESSRGISSGNLQGPDVARRHRRLMPHTVVASPVALVSCPSDRMPIGRRREDVGRRTRRRGQEPGWVAGCRRK